MNKRFDKRILLTGGCGFIGSHLVKLLVNKYPNYLIVNVDKLTYCGNLDNLKDIENNENYIFIKEDICNFDKISKIFKEYDINGVIHLAAESHVDNSIKDPFIFVKTNVLGTVTLLQAAKEYWLETKNKYENKMFYHVSTDEVYGALEMDETKTEQPYGNTFFKETDKYFPHSPYSASKASSDHFVRAYHDTYGLPIVISNCSNNYGGYQYPEKLIPLIFYNIVNEKPLPIYGKGENVRDWLYVEDHTRAIDLIFHKGKIGETYNIGGFNEWKNIDIVKLMINILDENLGKPKGYSEKLITYVEDRAGHDLRYAIDSSKLQNELGWKPLVNFEEGIRRTLQWYLENMEWLYNIKNKKK
nr:dTDP-glucose 4,6-dehydratase [Clostridia bacterium]